MSEDHPYFFPATDSTYSANGCRGITTFQYASIELMAALIKENPEMTPKDLAKLAVDHAEALQKRWEKL